ncbi:hypothetical protein GYMLUDRAFT_47052 [Collybiopsis luxurians FD-317 M1]|uniref:Uncharacterized protein n=1 Tax=Collybiopsis luxurians FD-317 M1 TaxID=944289 RepID=A0A0D0CET6_9AGAR|nr:hypothetical protein GYMLUDRAFT_47052 [Collybiopsis luxurians FD-317 M1]
MASPFSPVILGEDGEGVLPKKDMGAAAGVNANAGISRGEKQGDPQSSRRRTHSQPHPVELSGDDSFDTVPLLRLRPPLLRSFQNRTKARMSERF